MKRLQIPDTSSNIDLASSPSSPVREKFSKLKIAARSKASSFTRRRQPMLRAISHLVVNMGAMQAKVGGGHWPPGPISTENFEGAKRFLGGFGTLLARDLGRRAMLPNSDANGAASERPSAMASSYSFHIESNDYREVEVSVGEAARYTATGPEPPTTAQRPLSISPVNPTHGAMRKKLVKELDILVYNGMQTQEQPRLRALLDTGCDHNLIRRDLVSTEQLLPRPESLPPYLSSASNGHINILGSIMLRWRFDEHYSSSRTYEIPLLVTSGDAFYDVVLGFDFLAEANIYMMGQPVAMVFVSGECGNTSGACVELSDCSATADASRSEKHDDNAKDEEDRRRREQQEEEEEEKYREKLRKKKEKKKEKRGNEKSDKDQGGSSK